LTQKRIKTYQQCMSLEHNKMLGKQRDINDLLTVTIHSLKTG